MVPMGPTEGCPDGLRRFQFLAHVMSSNRLIAVRLMAFGRKLWLRPALQRHHVQGQHDYKQSHCLKRCDSRLLSHKNSLANSAFLASSVWFTTHRELNAI